MRKMKKNNRKSVKGITLLECIIAIAVLAIMGTLAARIAQVSCRFMMNTNHLEKRTNAEAPYGAARDANIETVPGIEHVAAAPSDIQITVQNGTEVGVVRATEYYWVDPTGATEEKAHLHYYVISHTPDAEEPTT